MNKPITSLLVVFAVFCSGLQAQTELPSKVTPPAGSVEGDESAGESVEVSQLIPVDGHLQPETIAIPPQIPGYRLFQVDRNVKVKGVLEGGGEFEAVLPLYVYYPNSKTINLGAELRKAEDLMGTIQAEMVNLRQFTGQQGSRRLNDSLTNLETIIETLNTIKREEINGFRR